MNCPFCKKHVSIKHLLFSEGTKPLYSKEDFNIKKLIFSNNVEPQFRNSYCPSCNQKISVWFNVKRIIIGIVISLWGLSLIDQYLLQYSVDYVYLYMLFSFIVISFSSITLREGKQINSTLISFRKNTTDRMEFAILYYVAAMGIIFLTVFYSNYVPSKDNLLYVSGKVLDIVYWNDTPIEIQLMKDFNNRTFTIIKGKQWSSVSKLKRGDTIDIYAKESDSVIKNSYDIFELSSDGEVIIPYDAIKKHMDDYANDSNRTAITFFVVLGSLYVLVRFIKLKYLKT